MGSEKNEKYTVTFVTPPASFIYRMALDSFVWAFESSAKPAAWSPQTIAPTHGAARIKEPDPSVNLPDGSGRKLVTLSLSFQQQQTMFNV